MASATFVSKKHIVPRALSPARVLFHMGGKAVQHHGRRVPGQRLGPAGIPGAAGVQLLQQGLVVLLILRERREKVFFPMRRCRSDSA